jgi:UDP-2,4-diacetamido-2,4,6-trideoxy-beta-L-altropyranose hydrolase
MNIVFRTDAAQHIGSGHVMRCLTLAEELRNGGVMVKFITREHKGNLNELIIDKGFDLESLSVQEDLQESLRGYEKWLGTTQEVDAQKTIEKVKNQKNDWLIIDHYALDKVWEEKLRPYADKIMVIDDLANRTHDCDILLDQNLFSNMEARYQGKTPDKCIKLLGPQYALLGRDYYKLRKQVKVRSLPIENVLIFFSNLDLKNLTSVALSALYTIDANFKSIDVVISKKSPNYKEVKNIIMQLPNAHLHSDIVTLAPLIVKADLAIGAGGSTHWERLCLGLPTLVITIAENQQPVSNELHKIGLIELIGHFDTVTKRDIGSAVKKILSHHGFAAWSTKCISSSARNGTKSVVDVILKLEQVDFITPNEKLNG